MKYNFESILDSKIYETCAVMFITGPYSIFNNIVVDEFKRLSKESAVQNINTDLMKEFDIEDDTVSISNTVSFENFMQLVNIPSVNGKWIATIDLKQINKKQMDWLKNYMKSPSMNGVLIVVSTEYRDYRTWLNNKIFNGGPEVSIIQLSFPNRDTLQGIVRKLFAERNARIESGALDLFVTRMSSAYDQYNQIIEKICLNCLPDGYMSMKTEDLPVITYQMAFDNLKGIENFVLDDFLNKLTEPLSSDKPTGRAIVFRMANYLMQEYGARKLVNMLLSRVNEIIEFRLAINEGLIPIIVNYDVAEAKKLIGEENKISSKSDYQFRKTAKLASRTSLQDWVYMKLILSNANKFKESSYDKVLYSLITRSVLTPSRINNDIGIEDILYKEINSLDSIPYVDQVKQE